MRTVRWLKRVISKPQRLAKNIRWRAEAVPIKKQSRADLFALDGHSSVIPDLMGVKGMPAIQHSLISDGNSPEVGSYQSRQLTKGLQPFTWDWANQKSFQEFSAYHSELLSSFKGFVAAHPSSFAAIYSGFRKPVLMNISTRFEYPFSADRSSYAWLLDRLVGMHQDGLLFPVANNVADKEYFELLTGIPAQYAPSLTSYVRASYSDEIRPEPIGPRVIFAKSQKLVDEISRLTGGAWVGLREAFKSRYSWRDLESISGAFVVPYNSSTMTLFELAQLNVPMVFPSLDMTRTLIDSGYSGVFSELHFTQVMGLNPKKGVGYRDEMGDIKWWYDRSDFLRSPLITSLSTFVDSAKALRSIPLSRLRHEQHAGIVSQIERLRDDAYKGFIGSIKG